MGIKELVGQVGENMKEFIEDSRQFGIEEALFQQHLKSRYPQVRLLDRDGQVIEEGLLTSLNQESYFIRFRAGHGYVSSGAPFDENTRIETKDGVRVTPEVFKELVETKAGKGYLDKLEKSKDALLQSLLQSPEIPDETKERLTKMIEDHRSRKV